MSMTMDDSIKRWTATRKTALVIEIIQEALLHRSCDGRGPPLGQPHPATSVTGMPGIVAQISIGAEAPLFDNRSGDGLDLGHAGG